MLRCKEVTIKFMDRNAPRQEIACTEIPASVMLNVGRDDMFLQIEYLTAKGLSVKELSFNLTDIKEYACTNIEHIEYVPYEQITENLDKSIDKSIEKHFDVRYGKTK